MSCALFSSFPPHFSDYRYFFSSPDNSLHEFIDLSEALETVGTSAYTGAIQYITNDVQVFLILFYYVR